MLVWIWLAVCDAYGGAVTTNTYGEPLHWQTDLISFRLNPAGDHGLDPDAIEMAVSEAISQWQVIAPDWLDLVYEGRTDTDLPDHDDGVQTVFFTDEWDDSLDPDLLALTYVWSYEDGTITHFDMAINTAFHEWSTDGEADSNDLCNAITHEFGHVLGLGHSGVGEATMYHETELGEVLKRDLEADDMRTFFSLYGDGMDTGDGFIGSVGCGLVSRGARGILACFAGLLVMIRRTSVARAS